MAWSNRRSSEPDVEYAETLFFWSATARFQRLQRVAKALIFALKGYEQTAQEVVGDAVFTERLQDEPCEMEDSGSWLGTSASAETSGLVLVRGIDVFSTSEADLRPLFGRCHVAYLPAGGRIVGLSKCARVAEVFARRLQTPERLANDIAVRDERLPPRCCPALLVRCHGIGVGAARTVLRFVIALASRACE